MAAIDSLCVLVEIEHYKNDMDPTLSRDFIKRVIRTYESRARADEDMELLDTTSPKAFYRIDDIVHIER